MREAREELGVNVATERVWGVLKPLRDMVSASAVMSKRLAVLTTHPFLSLLGEILQLDF